METNNTQNNQNQTNWPESLPWIDPSNLNTPKENSTEKGNKDWKQSLQEQRYERFVESLGEYFCESPLDHQAFIRDLERGLNEIEEWPRQQIQSVAEVRDCLRLHRLISSNNTAEI
jgi:hypothetical protein